MGLETFLMHLLSLLALGCMVQVFPSISHEVRRMMVDTENGHVGFFSLISFTISLVFSKRKSSNEKTKATTF